MMAVQAQIVRAEHRHFYFETIAVNKHVYFRNNKHNNRVMVEEEIGGQSGLILNNCRM